MNLANTNNTCFKCHGAIVAKLHYATWSRKNKNKIWHIDCDNPSLNGFDKDLLALSGTFFMKYPNVCKACCNPINKDELARYTKQSLPDCVHADCNNPSGRTGGYKFNPAPVVEPEYPKHLPVEPEPIAEPHFNHCKHCGVVIVEGITLCRKCAIEPLPKVEPVLTNKPTANDGLLKIIVDSVASELSNKVNEAIDEVKTASKAITDRLESELSSKLQNLVIPSIEVKRPDLPVLKINNVHKQFKEIFELLNANQNVYMWGAPGAGKTYLGPQLAEALDVRYYCVSLSEQSPEYKVTGFTSPITCQFVTSPFIDFYDEEGEGGLYHFTELDLANDNFRASLNSALENGSFSTDKGMIKRHKRNYILADGNTAGRGAHPAFPSRIAFDAAFAARFFFVEFEYDWDLARVITEQINSDCLPLVTWFRSASAWALANGIPVVLSPRELFSFAKLKKLTDLTVEFIFDGLLRGLDLISKEKLLENFPLPKL